MRKAIDILIDTSASMGQSIGGEPAERSKYKSVLSYIHGISHVHGIIQKVYEPDLHYGLCTFGACLQGTERDGTTVERLLELNLHSQSELTGKLQQMPEKLPYPAGTPLAEAILASIKELGTCDVQHRTILVFSDGQNKSGDPTMAAALAAAKSVEEHFEIYAVGLGINSLDDELRSLIEETGGTAIEVSGNEADKIRNLFAGIALKHLLPDQVYREAGQTTGTTIAVPNQTMPAHIITNHEEIVALRDYIREGIVSLRSSIQEETVDLRGSIQGEIVSLKGSMKEETVGLRGSIQGEIVALRDSMQGDTVGLKDSIQEEIVGLKDSMRALRQSLTEGEDRALERDTELQHKIHHAWRSNFMLGLVNIGLLAGAIALIAWTADGVFNMWDVLTNLSTYLTGSDGR